MPEGQSESIESATEAGSADLGWSRKTTLVAVPVDPYVVHCQWEVAPDDLEGAKQVLGVGEHEYWPVLQFYDVTSAVGEEAAPRPSFSVEVELGAGNWYVDACSPDRCYRADLALKSEEGSFTVIASSNLVETPPSAPSSYADAQWLPIRLARQLPDPVNPAQEPSASSIDMSEEVRSTLAALYGERIREIFAPPSRVPSQPLWDGGDEARGEAAAFAESREPEARELPVRSPQPIDMREEVESLLRRAYQGLEWDSKSLVGGGAPAILLRTPQHPIEDLTELNERSFTSGVSSRRE